MRPPSIGPFAPCPLRPAAAVLSERPTLHDDEQRCLTQLEATPSLREPSSRARVRRSGGARQTHLLAVMSMRLILAITVMLSSSSSTTLMRVSAQTTNTSAGGPCAKGFYTTEKSGDKTCEECPESSTTASTGAKSPDECKPKHGIGHHAHALLNRVIACLIRCR